MKICQFLCVIAFTSSTIIAYAVDRPLLRNRARTCKSSVAVSTQCQNGTALQRKSGIASFIQPDYSTWTKVKEGMSQEQVVALLGTPLFKSSYPAGVHRTRDYWCYGRLSFADERVPGEYKFLVGFNTVTQLVERVQDPFGSELTTGKPGTASIINPPANSVFDHFPRTIDFRWTPVSGHYPMSYEIQIQYKQPSMSGGNSWEWYDLDSAKTSIPYLTWTHPGKNPGRFRVRAVDNSGSGEWSSFREFDFR